jgi:hypothetical protein
MALAREGLNVNTIERLEAAGELAADRAVLAGDRAFGLERLKRNGFS